VKFAVGLWTERSEDDDKRLKDCQACASRLRRSMRVVLGLWVGLDS
jgi:hypothetical protein